jgi:hypothetical protein
MPRGAGLLIACILPKPEGGRVVPAVRLEPPTHIENEQVVDNIKGSIR